MSKITAEHLARGAIIYIRQSTPGQLLHNLESQRRQYGLADRAHQLGWVDVEVIDEDMGRSGNGIRRPGFERLLAEVCEGRVGAVFAIEASRLARNGRDWHTLIEFCGLVGTILVDEDGTYDPRHPNDRMVLGMKGTMSELELSLIRQRSQEALKQKARRGALFLNVAAGYVKTGHDRIEKDPDQRVQDALRLVFTKFGDLQSIRQVYVWFKEEGVDLPIKSGAEEARGLVWKLPIYNAVRNILTNPVYAGAYAFGRTKSKVLVDNGRKLVRRGVRRSPTEWDVLIKDQHEGYITWEEFERNQRVIADNATGKGSAIARGAARSGELLLAGLFRCGHCGQKMHVSYGSASRYRCNTGTAKSHASKRCISVAGISADQAVVVEVLRILKPLGDDAAVRALEAQSVETSAARRQFDLALTQARYEAAHARRQYDSVDPTNRLVASELERRWNAALEKVHRVEGEISALEAKQPRPLSEKEQQHLMMLGADLERAWSHPAAGVAARKRIIRAALHEIIVRIENGFVEMVLHWQSGDHTMLKFKMKTSGKYRYTISEDTLALVRQLARQIPDSQIAKLLNRAGKPTGRGNGWTDARVRSFRSTHEIPVYQEGEREARGEITLEAASKIIGVCPMTALRMIQRGELKGQHICKGAPWIIKAEDAAALGVDGRPRGSLTSNPKQHSIVFQ